MKKCHEDLNSLGFEPVQLKYSHSLHGDGDLKKVNQLVVSYIIYDCCIIFFDGTKN